MTCSRALLFGVASCLTVACGDDALSPADTEGTSTGGTSSNETTLPATTIEPATTAQPSATASGTIGETDDTTGEPTSGETSDTTGDPGPVCGNDMVDGDDECDGPFFGGADCITEGFDGGELSCTDECTIDTSACTTCDDGALEGDEVCDGDELGGETCVSQGFVSGDLACDASCAFDTTGCSNCGNGVLDVPEDCDMEDLGDVGCGDLGMTGGTLLCNVDCGYDLTMCTNFPRPGVGELVITEIMQNPTTVPDPDGEWFEVFNPDNATTYQLGGCFVEGNDADNGFEIIGDFEIAPEAYITLADDSSNPGFTPDYGWPSSDFTLNNGSDEVSIVCDAVTVDGVVYDDGATFPDPSGASMTLNQLSVDAVANDTGGNWCEGTNDYNGDFGTPGALNDVCTILVTYPIDFCRLQFPETIDEDLGTLIDVFGRLFIAGLTDASGVNDPAPEVIGYVGWGPDGTDPAVDGGWTWVEGSPNASYGPASPSYEANNDEYMAELTVPAPPGDYDFAFRFSGDSGVTFTYCDTGAGTTDGYAAADAGQMTSNAVPPPNLYFSEYLEGASNDKAVEIFNADSVDANLDLCVVNRYFGGAVMPSPISFTAGASLATDEVFVLCNSLISDATNCDQTTGSVNYNGDDAVELVCNGVTLDVIGQIGFDPGAEWLENGVGTQNEDLRRLCTVTTGDANGGDAFDPSVEWETFAQDDLSDLGTYNCP